LVGLHTEPDKGSKHYEQLLKDSGKEGAIVEIDSPASDSDPPPLEDEVDVVDLLGGPVPKPAPRRRILGDIHVRGRGRGRAHGVPPLPPPPDPPPPVVVEPPPSEPEPRPPAPDPDEEAVVLAMPEPPVAVPRERKRKLDDRWVPTPLGTEVLYESEWEHPKGSGMFPLNWQIRCTRHAGCEKSKFVTDKSTAIHGPIECLAFLHAWIPCNPAKPDATHRSCNPSKEQVAAVVAEHRVALQEVYDMCVPP